MPRYSIVESTPRGTERVERYEDLERHHPGSSESSSRVYATVDGHREEVKIRDRTEVVKDFVLQQDAPGPVRVPSPVTGYAHSTHDAYNSVFLYDRPFNEPGAQRIGAVLHMTRGTEPADGARVEYGKPIGVMGNVGSERTGVHVHMQLDVDTFKKYIGDVATGRIQPGGIVTATPPANTAAASDSGTLKDTLLLREERGEGVRHLQEALNSAGIRDAQGKRLPTTGYFGEQTEAAVRRYQEHKGLEVDGKAGENTLKALGIYPGQQQIPAQPMPTQTPNQQTPTQQTNPYGFGADNELGRLIGRGEGGYNSFNRGVAGDARGAQIDFSQMTVGEVMRRQDLERGDSNRLFAVGKYQFTPNTLEETVNALGVDRNARFTPQLQEKMFNDYLIDEKRPAIKAYITGQSSGPEGLERAQHALALEFASVGDPRKGGRGAYDGDSGGNSASIKTTEVATALNHMRDQYQQNIQAGQTPDQAYRALSGDPNRYSQSTRATTQGQTPAQSGGVSDTLLVWEVRGEGVKHLQEALNKAGIRDAQGQSLPTTGYYGEMTENAVRKYQGHKGLEVDGKAGENTLKSLGIYPGQQQRIPVEKPQQTDRPPSPTNADTQPSTQTDKPSSNTQTPQPVQTDKPPELSNSDARQQTQMDKPLISNPNHPDNRLYQQAVSNLEQLGPSRVKNWRKRLRRWQWMRKPPACRTSTTSAVPAHRAARVSSWQCRAIPPVRPPRTRISTTARQ